MEAIIPTEIEVPTLRTEIPKKAAAVHMASYQQRLANLYNRHVKPRAFRAGDLVLRNAF